MIYYLCIALVECVIETLHGDLIVEVHVVAVFGRIDLPDVPRYS